MGGKFKHTKDNDGIDYYPTPPSIIRQLLEVETFEGHILEPACGDGHMVNVLLENHICYASDKFQYENNQHVLDFLKCENFWLRIDNIITNPPFSIKDEFLLKAKTIATKKIAFLLPLDFYHGKSRYDNIWNDREFPLKKIWVFVRRPFFQKEIAEDTYTTGAVTMAWFIWDKKHKGEPTIGHIDNTKYVKGTGEYNKEVELQDGQILMEDYAS